MIARPIGILIADDHPIFRVGLRHLLATNPALEVRGEARDGAEAVAMASSLAPDLMLLDLAMPRLDGLGVLRELDRLGVHVRTVMLTADIEPAQVVASLRHGAVGVLLKSAATELLFRCIESVMAGQFWVDRGSTANLVGALRRYEGDGASMQAAPARLTPRERQIVAALVEGKSNKRIAHDLGVAEQTIKNALSQLYDRLEVTSRLELAAAVRQRGLLDPI